MVKVIKKDGTSEEFNVQKVVVAVNKSAYRALIQFTDAELEFICKFVEEKVRDMGVEEVRIAEMHNIVEGALEKVNPLVAKSYRDYRNYKQDFVQMLDEVYMAQADSGERVDGVVMMGIGEPLDNFDNVMAFLEILSDPRGLNLGLRHVSLSTCGLVDRIYALAERRLQLTLSVSLHAPNDAIRSRSMPVNARYNVDTLLRACRDYFAATGRRISFEYALIAGENDAPEHAAELAARLRGMGAHVNLIPVNPVAETGYRRGDRAAIERFQNELRLRGVNATIRRELGADISAACGQLRRQDADASTSGRVPVTEGGRQL